MTASEHSPPTINRGIYRTPDDIAVRNWLIIERTAQGKSTREIMVELRVSNRTVARVRRAAGVSPDPADPFTPAEYEVAAQMIADGASCKDVAKTLGRSAGTVARRFPGWTPTQIGQYASMCRRFHSIRNKSV